MRRIIIICGVIVVIVLGYALKNYLGEPAYLHEYKVSDDKKYIFPNLHGPDGESKIEEPVPINWRDYHTDNTSALAILLTDTASDWIGLVHGFKNIGIPFIITTSVQEAIQHNTVLVYPVISGKVMDMKDLKTLAAIPRNGGNLIGVNVYGGLNEVFGFDTVIANNSRSQVSMVNSVEGITNDFTHPHERNIRLTNAADFPDAFPSNGYTNARTPIFKYDDSSTFLAYKDYGVGKAFAFGIDIGNYFMRYMNERGFDAQRTYVNSFDGGIDVMLRMLKKIYECSPIAVTVGTVPYNKSINLVITHDIDYSKSIINTAAYAKLEKELGIKATYFIQTKYIKDWNDDIFFNQSTTKYLQQLQADGMEIASHSVSHSRVFSKFELGTGKETYPKYSPFVKDKKKAYNGSILGELRVSKFLLESNAPKLNVVSFRPGHLQNPFSLPQALKATGYLYSSCATANNAQTHLPFMRMFDRGYTAECDIVELPITIEDELGAPMLQRLDSAIAVANELSKYGGLVNVLIHTDTLGQKLEFERQLILALKDKAWITTIAELGQWWKTRDKVQVNAQDKGSNCEVTITNPTNNTIKGLSISVPANWKLISNSNDCIQQGRDVIVQTLEKTKQLVFQKQSTIAKTI